MLNTKTMETTLLRDLGDGLILRRSTPADADALGDFNSRIHSDDGFENPFEPIAIWTRDLLRGNHPTFGTGDFTISVGSITWRSATRIHFGM